jgi:hypothetical protein
MDENDVLGVGIVGFVIFLVVFGLFFNASVDEEESVASNPLIEPVKALNREIRPDSLSFYDVAVCLRGESSEFNFDE